MKFESIHSVYFVGIGGIGMSALARWFRLNGLNVAGYDRTATALCLKLEEEGIPVHYQDDLSLVPDWAKNPKNTLIVYTPAVPARHSELSYFVNSGFEVKKRSEVLGIISEGHFTIAVAGTHGKTTTSSMIAHLLHGSQQGCSAFVGGIMTNYQSNLIVGNDQAPVVVEADEFDRSFLRLHPDVAIVTSMDPDHLDIYGDPEAMTSSYLDFMALTSPAGQILLHDGIADKAGNLLDQPYAIYGISGRGYRAENIRVEGGRFVFDYHGDEIIEGIRLGLPGYHNVSNAVAATTVALMQGMPAQVIRERLESYQGVKRRFEYILQQSGLVVIDDYAHHPSEIEALLKSVRTLFPEREVTAIFQPHLYSRTRDFQDGFASSLDLADRVVLLDIYPAREEPIPGITSDVIFDKIQCTNKQKASKGDFPSILDQLNPQVLLTIGAGDIDTLVPVIRDYYIKKEKR
ncbi:MAG: UDP-N-acetylmuramate--L-alanine ligase [Cyclobacteriaceae bacterium]|nr:UDP-N-acetylmuramate--L-alanine ligase [Cyclobacteriaceae bacterium]